MHPLPTQETTESQDSQTTNEIRNTDAGSGLHDAPCSASSFVDDAVIEPSEEDSNKILVVWQCADGEVVDVMVDLKTDLELIRQWKNAGRKAKIVMGLNLDLVVKYPETFNLLVDTNY